MNTFIDLKGKRRSHVASKAPRRSIRTVNRNRPGDLAQVVREAVASDIEHADAAPPKRWHYLVTASYKDIKEGPAIRWRSTEIELDHPWRWGDANAVAVMLTQQWQSAYAVAVMSFQPIGGPQ